MGDKQPLTLRQAVEQVLAQVDGPITVDEFFRQVLTLRPSKAKKPTTALRNHVRWNEAGKPLVFLDAQTVLPLRVAMRGVRFRIPLSPQEAKRGCCSSTRRLIISCPGNSTPPRFNCWIRRAVPCPSVVVSIQEKVKTVFGTYVEEHSTFDLGGWFRANRVRRDDSVLVTIGDWDTARLRLKHEPANRRRESESEQKDRELADLLFAMLEDARDERLLRGPRLLEAAGCRGFDPNEGTERLALPTLSPKAHHPLQAGQCVIIVSTSRIPHDYVDGSQDNLLIQT